jgi:two-component system, sensor histidine kinase and response regulator
MDPSRFFELSLDLLCFANTDGYFLKVNPAFMAALGWTEQELLARRFLDFVHPEDLDRTLAQIDQLAAGVPTIGFDNRYRCVDGGWRWLNWRASSDPRAGVIYAVGHDVTALKQAGDEARRALELAQRASESKSAFLANMSHELRTPLNAILGYSELLLEELGSASGPAPGIGEQLTADLERIRHAGMHLLQLINQVLDLSKVESGHLEVRPVDVDLDALLASVLGVVRPAAVAQGNRLELEVPPRLGALHTDEVMLRQILLNLLSNSIRFTSQGTVRLRVELMGEERVRFEVEDSGIGFDPGELDRLFQPFVQADSSTTRRHGGTGLGLSISQRFAGLLGGRIEGFGEPGRGARFWFDLPRRAAHQPTEQAR